MESKRAQQAKPPPWWSAFLRRDGSECVPSRLPDRVRVALLRNHVRKGRVHGHKTEDGARFFQSLAKAPLILRAAETSTLFFPARPQSR